MAVKKRRGTFSFLESSVNVFKLFLKMWNFLGWNSSIGWKIATRFVVVFGFCLACLSFCFAICWKSVSVVFAMYLFWVCLDWMSAPFRSLLRRLTGASFSVFPTRVLVSFLGAVVRGISRMFRLFSLFFTGLL